MSSLLLSLSLFLSFAWAPPRREDLLLAVVILLLLLASNCCDTKARLEALDRICALRSDHDSSCGGGVGGGDRSKELSCDRCCCDIGECDLSNECCRSAGGGGGGDLSRELSLCGYPILLFAGGVVSIELSICCGRPLIVDGGGTLPVGGIPSNEFSSAYFGAPTRLALEGCGGKLHSSKVANEFSNGSSAVCSHWIQISGSDGGSDGGDRDRVDAADPLNCDDDGANLLERVVGDALLL
mmetsp:Transcript_36481/g.76919  ORF Transcript_36481/g.76919 Transcript_36481/m.76919 type:complete len:240 (-) Transcript_36481:494-1213(-)